MVSRNLVWTLSNVQHIARHGIRPEDVESMLAKPVFVRRGHKGYYSYYGQDAGGRYLLVVLDPLRSGRRYVVTARLMDSTERKMYLSRRRGPR